MRWVILVIAGLWIIGAFKINIFWIAIIAGIILLASKFSGNSKSTPRRRYYNYNRWYSRRYRRRR